MLIFLELGFIYDLQFRQTKNSKLAKNVCKNKVKTFSTYYISINFMMIFTAIFTFKFHFHECVSKEKGWTTLYDPHRFSDLKLHYSKWNHRKKSVKSFGVDCENLMLKLMKVGTQKIAIWQNWSRKNPAFSRNDVSCHK